MKKTTFRNITHNGKPVKVTDHVFGKRPTSGYWVRIEQLYDAYNAETYTIYFKDAKKAKIKYDHDVKYTGPALYTAMWGQVGKNSTKPFVCEMWDQKEKKIVTTLFGKKVLKAKPRDPVFG